MIALDTNALVRILIEDDRDQSLAVKETINSAEKHGIQVLIVSEVLIETVWVLESVYRCNREEIAHFLETLIFTPTFTFPDYQSVRRVVHQFKKGGDFADLLIVNQAMEHRAKKMISFDKSLQKRFPDYVVEKITWPLTSDL